MPKAYKKMKMKNGGKKVCRHPDNVMSLCWKDKCPIYMLSTWHNDESKTTTRIVRGGRREEIEKPLVISDYTENMGAVDKADHYCVSYSFLRKTLRWWRKLFFWMLEVSLINSFILYRLETHQPNLTRLQYRKKIILQLVRNTRNVNAERRRRPSSADDHERLQKIPHFIAKAASGHTKACMVCSTKQNRKTTVFFCETCSQRPG